MFGALGLLSGSKNPLINPFAKDDKRDSFRQNPIPIGGVGNNTSGTLPTSPRYGRGASSLSI